MAAISNLRIFHKIKGKKKDDQIIKKLDKESLDLFQKSLKPLIVLVKVLTGVPTFDSIGPGHRKWLFAVYRFVILAIVAYGRVTTYQLGSENNMTELSEKINFLSFLFYYGVVPFTFIAMSFTGRWSRLWDHFKQIEDLLRLNYQNYFHKMKFVLLLGFLILLLNTSSLLYEFQTFHMWITSRDSFLEAFQRVVVFANRLITAVVVVLFVSLVIATSLLFTFLNDRLVDEVSTINSTTEPQRLLSEMRLWRRQHFLVIQLVHKISSCFGLILLFCISNGIVCFLMKSYLTVTTESNDFARDINHEGFLNFWFSFLDEWVRSLLVMVFPAHLQTKAYQIKLNLLKMKNDSSNQNDPDKFHCNAISSQVDLAIKQSSRSNSAINAAGFFKVDHSIFPAVFGVVLTYLVIIYDFAKKQTNEKPKTH